ncbi:hypothetical protein H9L13_08395 [Sphingomonas lutea]|uniref:CPBP family intramembrane metalloprotease n=1 Tax=Sphingomonas lutea TaxID=1045317 RepID=A0A7G9SFS9_9SPHN|nr:hypothetical protein [Sphingomonas lutea]QNN66704.1 hypothetical protein H9L13_08395 [Sphingomonas lutea]
MSQAVTAAPFREGPLSFFPKLLREPGRAWLVVPVAWLLCIVPSLGLAYLVSSVAPQLDLPEFPIKGHVGFLALAVFAPVVETLILAAIVTVLRLFLSPTLTVFVSAAGWGLAHSLEASAWGLVVWWPFLIMSMLYLVWRERSIWLALAIPAAVHMMQNAGPAYQVAYGT